MPNIDKRSFLITGLALLAAGGRAQGYPDRPIKLVMPYAPGGPTDLLGRIVGEQMEQSLKQPLVVENRAGAGGIVAMTGFAKAAPDGYTLMVAGVNLAVAKALHARLPFDPAKDFTPIALLATAPLLMLVPQNAAARTAQEFFAMAKSSSQPMFYASAGIGSTTHLTPELLKKRYSLDLRQLPFQGASAALTAVAAGQASVAFVGLSGAKSLIEAGKLRAVAITGDERSDVLPDVPTLKEAGIDVPELSVGGSWWGLFGPPGLPAALKEQIRRAAAAALASPATAEQFKKLNIGVPAPQTNFARWVQDEAALWSDVLKHAGVEPK